MNICGAKQQYAKKNHRTVEQHVCVCMRHTFSKCNIYAYTSMIAAMKKTSNPEPRFDHPPSVFLATGNKNVNKENYLWTHTHTNDLRIILAKSKWTLETAMTMTINKSMCQLILISCLASFCFSFSDAIRFRGGPMWVFLSLSWTKCYCYIAIQDIDENEMQS